MNKLLLVISALTLCACTAPQVIQSVSNNDWQALGHYDGVNGFKEKTDEDLRQLNKKYGSKEVDSILYRTHYELGLDIYCTPKNAYLLGMMGKPYNGICDKYPHGWEFFQDWSSANHSQM